jgi:ABC-type multidrug transport system fused ATPase/permease subunit
MAKKATGWKADTLWRVLSYNKEGAWRIGLIIAIQFCTNGINIKLSYLYSQWGVDAELQTDWHMMMSHTIQVLIYVVVQLLVNIVEDHLKSTIRRRMMATVKQDLLRSVLNAPVNLFFDLMPTSKIQGKLQGDIWCIEGLFWFCTWMISEFISINTTIMLIAQ